MNATKLYSVIRHREGTEPMTYHPEGVSLDAATRLFDLLELVAASHVKEEHYEIVEFGQRPATMDDLLARIAVLEADCKRAEDKLRYIESVSLLQPMHSVQWFNDALAEAREKFGKPDPMTFRARHVVD